MCFIKVNLVETTIARDVFYRSSLLSEREKLPLTCEGRPVRMGSGKKVKARPRTRKSPPTASPIVFGQGSNSSPSKLCPPSQTPPTSIRRETTKRLLLQTGISLSLYISISQKKNKRISCERGKNEKNDKAKGLFSDSPVSGEKKKKKIKQRDYYFFGPHLLGMSIRA